MLAIDPLLRTRVTAAFAPLTKKGAEHGFPPRYSLSTALEALYPSKAAIAAPVHVKPSVATLFATAAVEVWFRGIHSFLISAALTEASPIWASVSGYYSSHYSVRAFSHLLGYFILFRRHRIVKLELNHGKYYCDFGQQGRREHRLYWLVLKRDPYFITDPLFTENEESGDVSDAGHRNRANYADLLFQHPPFRPLDEQTLRSRVRFISQIQFNSPPIPRRNHFPDIESVQVVAYHRLVRFRRFLDEILGGRNRFWTVHRNAAWTDGLLDFQLIEQSELGTLSI